MKDIERLYEALAGRFPDHKVEIDPAETETGEWFIMAFRPGLNPVVVSWRPREGFGISTPADVDFGVGVSEVFADWSPTRDRAIQLVESGGSATVPLGVRLMEIRQSRGVTQAGLALVLGTSQVNVSKAEHREDMQVGTLARHVAALGGRLVLRAEFPDGRVEDLSAPAPGPTAVVEAPADPLALKQM